MMTVIVDCEIQTGELELPDGDYIMKYGRAWFTVGNKSVRICASENGLSVQVYPLLDEAGTALGILEVE